MLEFEPKLFHLNSLQTTIGLLYQISVNIWKAAVMIKLMVVNSSTLAAVDVMQLQKDHRQPYCALSVHTGKSQ